MAKTPACNPKPAPVAPIPAVALLKAAQPPRWGAVLVLFGEERFLKGQVLSRAVQAVLGNDSTDLAIDRLDGSRLQDLKDVLDRLLTLSMFNPRQVVVVDDADEFVSRHREGLEHYLEHPNPKALLVLDVKSWASNTRLYAKVAQVGLAVSCQRLTAGALPAFLRERAHSGHNKVLEPSAAQLLVELVGADLVLLDQELAKLAASVGESAAIDADAVSKLVGGWKAEVTWAMLDAVRDGKLDVAFRLLEKLLIAGEPPVKLLGGASYVFRPMAQAVELARGGTGLSQALAAAGVKPMNLGPAASYLRRLGRARAENILKLLLQADQGLKGGSMLSERTILEQLFVGLAGLP